MAIDLRKRYREAKTWQQKVTLMEIYHLCSKSNIVKTADFFSVSVGLVSENLKIAAVSHEKDKILKLKTRQEALDFIKGKRIFKPTEDDEL